MKLRIFGKTSQLEKVFEYQLELADQTILLSTVTFCQGCYCFSRIISALKENKIEKRNKMVLPNFKENLEKYAKIFWLQTESTCNLVTLWLLNIDVEQRELAHLIVKEAYALGRTEVIVQWADDFTNREKFLHAPMDRLDNVPDYKIAEMNYLLEHKASRLGVRSSDPGALNGVDAEKLSASAKALELAMKPMRIATQSNKVSWTVAAAAGLRMGEKGLPKCGKRRRSSGSPLGSNLQDLPDLRRRSS